MRIDCPKGTCKQADIEWIDEKKHIYMTNCTG